MPVFIRACGLSQLGVSLLRHLNGVELSQKPRSGLAW